MLLSSCWKSVSNFPSLMHPRLPFKKRTLFDAMYWPRARHDVHEWWHSCMHTEGKLSARRRISLSSKCAPLPFAIFGFLVSTSSPIEAVAISVPLSACWFIYLLNLAAYQLNSYLSVYMPPETMRHLVFEEISQSMGTPWLFESPDEKQFDTCRAITAKTNVRCPNRTYAAKEKRGAQARTQWQSFATLHHATILDEPLFEALQSYVTLIHCGKHVKIASRIFKEWRDSRTMVSESETVETSSQDDLSREENPAYDDVQIDENDEVEERTMDHVAKVASSEKVDCHVSVTEIVQGNITMTPDTHDFGEAKPTAVSRKQVEEVDLLITAGVATLQITDVTEHEEKVQVENNGNITMQSSDVHVVKSTHTETFPELGTTKLQRVNSLRDDSSIFREMHKPLKGHDLKEGVVYILKMNGRDDMYKVGWTEGTAIKRHGDSGNCYAINTQIVYESKERFYGAYRVEKLVKTILRRSNLIVKDCIHCGKGHTEWFRVAWVEVWKTMWLMETLVKLPGYTEKDGEMRLSEEAYGLIESMSKFDMGKLELAMESTAASQDDDTGLSSEIPAPTAETVQDRDMPLQSIESSINTRQTRGHKTRAAQRIGQKSGIVMGKMAKGAMDLLAYTRRTMSAEPDQDDGDETGRRRSLKSIAQGWNAQKVMEQFLTDFRQEFQNTMAGGKKE
ncbi:hypothetical protein VHEMI05858 [[Torrubiella] hemipterigena]|uniref:Bacteriophage T5 Orf172 DNA-binding domain-containing protein n=1 Tax=[Torrubiella] hemipterigena TaxID=1531966 RepID=A0A0A1T5G3_9HYPO|nr:hypothetical protein VHEMI05858 [[Torrubiella] hemipterigena]